MRNQSRKTSRVQVAEGPWNHVEFDLFIFFLRPTGGDLKVLSRGVT